MFCMTQQQELMYDEFCAELTNAEFGTLAQIENALVQLMPRE